MGEKIRRDFVPAEFKSFLYYKTFQEQNEQQLKILRNEMNDMKKMKVKLMRQMRDEVCFFLLPYNDFVTPTTFRPHLN